MAAFIIRWFSYRSVRVAVLALVFLVLLSRVDRAALLGQLWNLHRGWLLVMVAVNVLILLISSWRWSLFAAATGVEAPWLAFIRTTWFSWAAAECGPSLVVSEWARYRLMRGHAAPIRLAISQFVDRLSAYGGLLLVTLLSVLCGFGPQEPAGAAIAAVGVGLVVASVFTWRLGAALDRDRANLRLIRRLLVKPLPHVLSLITNALFAVNFVFAAMAMGVQSGLWDVLMLAPLVLLGAGSLPSLVSDWGKREVAATLAFSQLGFTAELGLGVSLVYGSMNLLSALPGIAGLLVPASHGRGGQPGVVQVADTQGIEGAAVVSDRESGKR